MPQRLTSKLAFFALIFLAVILVTAGFTVASAIHLERTIFHLTDEVTVQLVESGEYDTHVTRAIREIQTFVLAEEEDEIDEAREALTLARANVERIDRLFADNSDDEAIHVTYRQLNRDRQALIDQLGRIADRVALSSNREEEAVELLFAELEQLEVELIRVSSSAQQTLDEERALVEREAITSGIQTFASITIGILVPLALSLFLLLFVQRRIAAPIQTLAAANEAFARNEPVEPVQISGNDEIGVLQRSFNTLITTIKQQTNELIRQAAVADDIRAQARAARQMADELAERNVQIEAQSASLQREIVERQLVESALIEARDSAEAANRAKSAFLATMSHELRTPLTAIIGYSYLMDQMVAQGDYSRVAADLTLIQNAGKHLLTLINDLLDISRIEAGKLHMAAEQFDLARFVTDMQVTVAPLINQNHNTLILSCPPDIGVIRTDPTRLRQALLNLLSNAAKFTENGRISLTVKRQSQEGTDWISFEVSDTGIGIAPEQIHRLFKTFSQIDDSPTRKYGGTGLGLALSQRLANLLGGTITVQSKQGGGSTFTLYIPAVLPEASSSGEALKLTPAPRPSLEPAREPPADLSDAIVLVIDDDPAVGDLLSRMLTPLGLYVVYASSGQEGLELAGEILPELILLDVLMPGMDGWEVLAAIKADPALCEIPVVIVSIDEQQQRGLALGVADYIVKPIDQARLLTAVQLYRRGDIPVAAGSHLLIVEDDPIIAGMFERVFAADGWEVRLAVTGLAALAAVVEAPPAAILLDLMLPEMDGIQVCAALRALPTTREIPIIVVTAKDLSQVERAQLQSSVAHILQKGTNELSELTEQVQRLVQMYRRPGSTMELEENYAQNSDRGGRPSDA